MRWRRLTRLPPRTAADLADVEQQVGGHRVGAVRGVGADPRPRYRNELAGGSVRIGLAEPDREPYESGEQRLEDDAVSRWPA